jgi:general stress protein 26
MVDQIIKQKATQYLRSKFVAVISTVSQNNQPESATVYFDVDENFNFYIMTKQFTRKYKNIQQNQQVALVIGTDNEPATVQVQGKAEEISDSQEFDKRLESIKQRFFQNEYVAPLFQLQSEKNEVVLFKIVPSWIRWLDLRGENTNGEFIQLL